LGDAVFAVNQQLVTLCYKYTKVLLVKILITKPILSKSIAGVIPNFGDKFSPYVRIDVASINSHQPYWGRSKDMQ